MNAQTAARMAYLKARPALSPGEAAELAGVSLSTVRRSIAAGELPARKLGRRVLIPTASVLSWIGADIEAPAVPEG